MVHISQLAYNRVEKVCDVLNIGDTAKVKVVDVDTANNKISLSIKDLLPKPEGYVERPPFKKPFNKKPFLKR
jgi:polyribonucleotide nucleotidyltransferase